MLRIYVATREEFDRIWQMLMPQSRQRVEWTGTDSLVVNDCDGPILVTIGKARVVRVAPERLKPFLTMNGLVDAPKVAPIRG